jgi:hypothetical protein
MKLLCDVKFAKCVAEMPAEIKYQNETHVEFHTPEVVHYIIDQPEKPRRFGIKQLPKVHSYSYNVQDKDFAIVSYLVESQGITFTTALVMAAELCTDCKEVMLLELEGRFADVKTYRPVRTRVCGYCRERQEIYEPYRKKETVETPSE